MPSPELTMPFTASGPDEIGHFSLNNRSIQFSCVQQELLASCSIHVPTHFGDSTGELTTSAMKKGIPDTNGSDLNKDNIIKPTLNHLSEEDCKVIEAYQKEVDEIFLSCYEVMQ
jgi:hypothetical protein